MGDRRDGVAPGVAEMVDAAAPRDDARSNQMSRRETRTKYRLMQTDIETNREEMKQVNSRKLATMIDKVEEVYNTTNVGMKTREQELDLKIVSVLTGIGHDMSKNLNQNGRSRYTTISQVLNGLTSLFMRGRRKDEQTLADEDAEFVSDGAMDWAALGSAASKYCFGVETMDFMDGVMNTEIKERKMTQRAQKVVLGELAKPEELESTKNEHEKTTAKNMQRMVKELNKFPNSQCPVIDAVFNGQSFAQFVENVFTLSFLVSQGQVSITREEGQPSVVRRNSKEKQEKTEKEERIAHVMALDVQGWKELCKQRKNKPGIMPHREEATQEELLGRTGKLTSPSKNKETRQGGGGGGNDDDAFTIQSIVEDEVCQSPLKKKSTAATTATTGKKKSLFDVTNSEEERAALEPRAKKQNRKKGISPKKVIIPSALKEK